MKRFTVAQMGLGAVLGILFLAGMIVTMGATYESSSNDAASVVLYGKYANGTIYPISSTQGLPVTVTSNSTNTLPSGMYFWNGTAFVAWNGTVYPQGNTFINGTVQINGTVDSSKAFNTTSITMANNATGLNIPVGNFYSRSISMPAKANFFTICASCTPKSGALAMTWRWEQGVNLPATEGVADNNWSPAFNSAGTIQDIITSSASTNIAVPFSPMSMPYGRLFGLNTATVGASCTITLNTLQGN